MDEIYNTETYTFDDELPQDNLVNTMKQKIRQTFSIILELLENYNANSDLIEQHILENKIMCLLPELFIYTEPFWEDMAWVKDIFSYNFNKREFPLVYVKVVDEKIIINHELSITDLNKLAKSKTIGNLIKSRSYGDKKSIIKMLDDNYIDEGVCHYDYKVLDVHKYYEFIRQDVIDKIFSLCNDKKLYCVMLGLYCSMVCSKELSHLMFQNHILNIMFNPHLYASESYEKSVGVYIELNNPFLDPDYLEIINYCMFYGFYLHYKEECIIKTYAQLQHRHAFDLDAFSKIPIYTGPLDTHPLIPLTLSSNYLYANNIATIDYVIKPISGPRGLYSIWSFWKRFEIFTNGMFNNISIDKIYFGGSVISACVIKNPLELLFGIKLNANDDLIFEKQLSQDPIHLKRIGRLFDFWDSIKVNLVAYFDEYYPSKNIIPRCDDFDIKKLMELEDVLSDIDIKVDVIDDIDFDVITDKIYQTVKKNIMIRSGLDSLSNYQLQLVRIDRKKSYKYYISGALVHRSIEIFRLYGIHPLGGVARYHFPCVRGIAIPTHNIHNILVGQVKMHPSLCSFAHTGIMIDYKWMAHGHITQELILKYYIRGCVILLNEKEHLDLKKYIIENSNKWGFLLKYANFDRVNSVNSPIFKPRKLMHSAYYDISKYCNSLVQNELDYEYIVDEPIHPYKKSKFGFDLLNRILSGHIRPIYLWQISAYISSLRRSKKYNY